MYNAHHNKIPNTMQSSSKDSHSVYFKRINEKGSLYMLNTDATNVGLTT